MMQRFKTKSIYSLFFTLIILFLASLQAKAMSKQEKQLLRLIPQKSELSQWHMTYEPRFFDEENLFEYINGAADLYIMYGFRLVVTADYAVGADSSSVNVEIYAMKSPLHAFGIYAAERSPDEAPAEIGVQGYIGANVLNFYKGPYYIKITSFALSEDLSGMLKQMGQYIADQIKGEYKEPEMLQRFPRQDLVERSERFIPTNFLGQSYLSNGYRCDYYTEKSGTYQLFLIPFKKELDAEEAFDLYKKFLLETNRPHRFDKAVGYQRILVYGSDQYDFAFCSGAFIGGATGTACPDAIKNKMQELGRNLE
ncbi:hypothetical protein JXO59_00760 [candidate division KSB1 bacterium]|nr:hypothetical protein [candidate division KSB1 bacterium]